MPHVDLHSLADKVEIAPGVNMPRLGIGTYMAEPGPVVEQEVEWALELGYRLVDTSRAYGNEESIGKAIRASGVPREEVFVTTKVDNTDQGYRRALDACAASLGRLGMDHVDLLLVHWYVPGKLADTWRAMEELLARGFTRAIGVSNHQRHHLDELLACANVPPAVDQIEHHPRLQQPELVGFCRERGITVEAWAPVMRGRVCDIPELAAIGERHGKTAPQVTLRWMLQRGVIAIPQSIRRDYLVQNADVFDFELADDEMASIDALDRGERIGEDPDTRGDMRLPARLGRAWGRLVDRLR